MAASEFDIGIGYEVVMRVTNTEDGPEERHVDYFYIIAAHPGGKNFVYAGIGEGTDRAAVEAALNALKAAGSDPATKPEDWSETYPVYGSDAWDLEAERDLACLEADAFSEPRPNW